MEVSAANSYTLLFLIKLPDDTRVSGQYKAYSRIKFRFSVTERYFTTFLQIIVSILLTEYRIF